MSSEDLAVCIDEVRTWNEYDGWREVLLTGLIQLLMIVEASGLQRSLVVHACEEIRRIEEEPEII